MQQERYGNQIESLELLGLATLQSQYCSQVVSAYVCNTIYPPCEDNGTTPLDICQEDCMKYILMENPCEHGLRLIGSKGGAIIFHRQCNVTLQVVKNAGVSVNTSSNCVNITG